MTEYGRWRSLIDGIGIIPDSEADQKLAHRWTLIDVNGTVEDSIGSAGGTNNGVTFVSGDWAGAAAGAGDGSGFIETTNLGSFGSNLGTDLAVAFSISYQNSDGDDVLGVVDNNMALQVGDNIFGTTGQLELFLRDSNGNHISAFTQPTFDDGDKYRVVFNKTGNAPFRLSIYTNQSEEDYSVTGTTNFGGGFNDFTIPLYLFATNFGGDTRAQFDGIIDDICIFDDSLTQSEIESYDNPWL